MALVILSAGASTDSQVRTLSVNRLLLGVAAVASITLLAGFGLGYGLAREEAPASPVVQADPTGEPESRFLIGRVGELSGRLMRLESEAMLLAKRIGLKRDVVPATLPEKPAPAPRRSAEAEGGPMIPAVGTSVAPEAESQLAMVGNSLQTLEQDLARLESALTSIDEMAAQKSVLSMIYPSRLPVSGSEVGSGFGNRRDPFNNRLAFHSGLDFPSPSGTPIRASAGGLVVYAGYRGDYGRQVEIDHGNGLVTRYSHASRLRVKIGDVVTPGQHIADIGSSGRSTGPHLHFEVLKSGRFVDPEDYLRAG